MPVKKKSISSTQTKIKTAKKIVVKKTVPPVPPKPPVNTGDKLVKVLSKVTKYFSLGPEKFAFIKDSVFTIKKHQADYLKNLDLIVILD